MHLEKYFSRCIDLPINSSLTTRLNGQAVQTGQAFPFAVEQDGE